MARFWNVTHHGFFVQNATDDGKRPFLYTIMATGDFHGITVFYGYRYTLLGEYQK